jgi:hypothetical protein
MLGFMYLRQSHWLEVLIAFSLSVKMVSTFRKASVVARLRCYFLPLDWVWLSSHLQRAPGLISSIAQIEVN